MQHVSGVRSHRVRVVVCRMVVIVVGISALVSLAIMVWVIYLYREHMLKEDHAILWFLVALSVMLLSLWQGLLFALSEILGVLPTSVILAAFIGFLIVVSVYFSMKLSQLSDRIRLLAQEVAILRGTSEYQNPPKTGIRRETDETPNDTD